MMNNLNPDTTACFTGHRILQASLIPALRTRLAEELILAFGNGYRTFLCGGARGFDTLAAQEVLRFRESCPDVHLVLALPCADQPDRWPSGDKKAWKDILEQADEVHMLSEFYYTGCMQVRNRFMVDRSSLCLCYMLRFEGGTWSTVRYALHSGLMLKNLAMPDRPSPSMKENPWNFMSIFRSAYGNANTVRLSLSPLQWKRKMHMFRRCSGKRN